MGVTRVEDSAQDIRARNGIFLAEARTDLVRSGAALIQPYAVKSYNLFPIVGYDLQRWVLVDFVRESRCVTLRLRISRWLLHAC